MKKRKHVIAVALLAAAVVAAFVYLGVKAAGPRIVYPVEAVGRRTIELKVVASGTIIPEKEVEVKSFLSGVVDEVFAEPGNRIRRGDRLVSIRLIPNSLDLNSAEAAREKAAIRLKDAETVMNRNQGLFEQQVIAEVTWKDSVSAYQLAMEDFKEARNRISLIKEGISSGGKTVNNVISSPIDGTLLDIPVKEGTPIQENGGFSVGTTVAIVADMDSLLFEGEIDEAQINDLESGMEANIRLAAVEDRLLKGTVSFLSPRGRDSSGSVKFKIRIAFPAPDDLRLRAGYSASAEIILRRAENVVCVREKDLVMEGDQYYAEVETGRQKFDRREVTVGVSDGLYTELTAGLAEGERIKTR